MSQALVLFSPQHLGGREVRKSTEGDNVVCSSRSGSPNVLVIFLAPQAAQIHRGSAVCRPFPCARAERFVTGSSSLKEQCKSNGAKKD